MTNVLDPNFKTPTTPQEVAELCIQSIQATLERNDKNLPTPKGEIVWLQNLWASGEINSDNLIKIENDTYGLKCPSTGCVAGTAAALTGWYLHVDRSQARQATQAGNSLNVEASSVINDKGEFSVVEDAGREALGLTQLQSSFLFSGDRTSFEVLYVLNLIKNKIYWRARWLGEHYVLLDKENKEIIAFV